MRAEDDANPAFRLGQRDIAGVVNRADEIRHGLKPLVPLAHSRQGFSGVLVVGNGDVNAVQASFVHLLEDLARPRRVLQSIDDCPFLIHGLAPRLGLNVTRFDGGIELSRILPLLTGTEA